jgi:hypothetical protein
MEFETGEEGLFEGAATPAYRQIALPDSFFILEIKNESF